ncbi:hypothetical protein BHE74_00032636 [Ensete ventricosum]|nr:hypothetical protein GW17_00059113 [Ensete ventricosum]RWW60374.1 hypothetical protein BHE74_00032636 [Ensete ventricosum]RZS18342.1 hypothetical protein BHM03_00050590 [Ensete ventricosum]
MAVIGEENTNDRGGSSADDRWKREINVVEAGSVMQAAMLTAVKGGKGDGGSDRRDYRITVRSSATKEERDYNKGLNYPKQSISHKEGGLKECHSIIEADLLIAKKGTQMQGNR